MTELEFPLFSGKMSQIYIQIIQTVDPRTPHYNLS